MLGEFAVSLFAYEFVAGVPPPEINTGALEEVAGDSAEKLYQGIYIGALSSFCRNKQKEILKGIVEVGVSPASR